MSKVSAIVQFGSINAAFFGNDIQHFFNSYTHVVTSNVLSQDA